MIPFRRARHHSTTTIAAAAVIALAAGCVVGAPPGFSDGDTWTVPIVNPLDTDVLVVPVKVNGAGPYAFVVDPDSASSSVDEVLVNDLQLYTVQTGKEEANERDTMVPVFISEVKALELGSLTVRNLKLRVGKFGVYWIGGRRVRGVIGKDVIADSLVVSIDRDRGIMTLAKQGKLSPPPAATELGYRRFFGRYLAKVAVDGKPMTMHVDLGGPVTQLWKQQIGALGLAKLGGKWRMTDEYSTVWELDSGSSARSVRVGPLEVHNVAVVEFGDRRFEPEQLDGALGQNFLSRFNVVVNWHQGKFWLSPRARDLLATAPDRLARWGAVFQGCQNPACVSVKLIPTDPDAEPAAADGTPAMRPPGGHQLIVEREPARSDTGYEILVEAVDGAGRPIGLPRLQITLPAGQPTVIDAQADPNYAAAASFRVIDVSPFARDCEPAAAHGAARCIWQRPIDR